MDDASALQPALLPGSHRVCSGAEAGAKRGKEEEGHSAIPCRKERGRSCEVERVECVLFFSLRADIMVARKEERERGDRDRRRRMLSEVLNWVKTLIPHHRASYSCPSPSLFLLLIFHNASFFPSPQSSISAAAWKKIPFVGWGETPPL